MANILGYSDVMEELKGGYVKINQSAENDGIIVAASQSIGNQNSQWIQLDTNVPWSVGENGGYMFEDITEKIYNKNGGELDYAGSFYSYNNEGYVSFILYLSDCEKINRANIVIELTDLYEISGEWDEDKKRIATGNWKLSWTNKYADNTITKHPFKAVSLVADDGTEYDILIHKIEISPISIRMEAWMNPLTKDETKNCVPNMDSVTLQNGTDIDCAHIGSRGMSGLNLEMFISFEEEIEKYNLYEIDYITVGGEKIYIKQKDR